MKRILCSLVVFTLVGCSAPPPAAPAVTTSKSQVSTVDDGSTTRTEAYSRTSQSDASGANASTHQSAQQTNPDGSTSAHSSDVATDSRGVGYSRDDHHIVVSGTNVTHEFTANGEDLAVSGNGNQLVFTGSAHGLSVTGNENTVRVEGASIIDVTGERNTIVYAGSTPQVTDKGKGNTVKAE